MFGSVGVGSQTHPYCLYRAAGGQVLDLLTLSLSPLYRLLMPYLRRVAMTYVCPGRNSDVSFS